LSKTLEKNRKREKKKKPTRCSDGKERSERKDKDKEPSRRKCVEKKLKGKKEKAESQVGEGDRKRGGLHLHRTLEEQKIVRKLGWKHHPLTTTGPRGEEGWSSTVL